MEGAKPNFIPASEIYVAIGTARCHWFSACHVTVFRYRSPHDHRRSSLPSLLLRPAAPASAPRASRSGPADRLGSNNCCGGCVLSGTGEPELHGAPASPGLISISDGAILPICGHVLWDRPAAERRGKLGQSAAPPC